MERKILSLVGSRLGPNKVRFLGIFQPINDAIKLSNKSINFLSNLSFFYYYMSSFFTLSVSVFVFSNFFSRPGISTIKHGLIFFLVLLGLNSLNRILCGWRVFRKYCILGRIRTVSQLISYEAVLYFCLFFFLYNTSIFRFSGFSYFPSYLRFLWILPCFYIWIPTFLAELNRTPYDFSEGERELVRGYNTEFSSSCFTLIFVSEYRNILFFCFLSSFLFYGSFHYFFSFIFIFFVIWFRSLLPRFRFDKLMLLAWKFFIPFITVYFVCEILF